MEVFDDDFSRMMEYIFTMKASDLQKKYIKNADVASFVESYKWLVNAIAYEPDLERRVQLLSKFNNAMDPLIELVKEVQDFIEKKDD